LKREIIIIFSEDANKQFQELNKIVGEETSKGTTNSIHQQLLKSINHKIDLLKINPQAGTHVPQNLIPKIYKDKYDINNLWKIDLTGYWRMTYTLRTTEIEITNFILDILDHPAYDKLFGYRRK